MDGEIDYSTYSLSELREAESHISRDRYPKNYSNLKQEVERRTADEGDSEIGGQPAPEERVWERLENPGDLQEMATNKIVKYIASFVAVATVLNIITTSTLEAYGYSFGHLPRIFTYSIAAMVVGWMFVSAHGRLFYRSEAEQFIIGSIAGVILLDLTMSAIVMIFFADMPSASLGQVFAIAVGLLLVYLFDLLLVFVAYRFPARLLMLRLLNTSGGAREN